MAEELEKQEGQQVEEVEGTEEEEEGVDAKALLEELQTVKQEMQTYKQMLNQMQQQQAYDPDDYVEIPEPEKYTSPFDELDEDELEAMPRKQLIRLLKEDVKKEVSATVLPEAVGDLDDRLSQVTEAVAETIVRLQVEEARKKYTDFDNYRPAMLDLSQRYPNLGVEELYRLAKYGHEPPPGAATPPARSRPPAFKGTRKPASVKPKNEFVSFRDAASDAWNEVMGGGSGE